MSEELAVEVCVDSIESAIAAERGGAQRVELCSDLVEGGITPSAGLIATVRKKISIGLYTMVRPRAGDFYYDADEFAVMQRDVLMAKQLGADGVVFGILGIDAEVDITRTRQLVDLGRPMKSTFHRAFDMSADLQRSLESVIATGADRILTSGAKQTALAGTVMLRNLVEAAAGRVIIMACGGINAENVRVLVEKTGVREIHAGLRTSLSSPMRHRNDNISLGTVDAGEYQRFVVRKDTVEQLVREAHQSN
jgi:copper homeostasis protein